MLVVGPGIADFGTGKLGAILDCVDKNKDGPFRIVKRHKANDSQYVVTFMGQQPANQEKWVGFVLRVSGEQALLTYAEAWDGSTSSSWNELLLLASIMIESCIK